MKDKTFIPQAHDIIGAQEALATLEFAISKSLPTLLISETGMGKTAYIRHLAHKHQKPLRRVNLNGQTSVDEFVGKTLLNEKGTFWQDGILVTAMKEGHWLVLDEINAALPEILFVLHSLMDDDHYVVLSEKDGEVIRPHANFRLFATMNPSGKYAGTKDLNKALMSRFPIVMQIDFAPPEVEAQIIQSYSNLDKVVADRLVSMAKQLREAYFKEEIDYICSTRDLINVALLASELDIHPALKLSIFNRVAKEDLKAVETVASLYFGKETSLSAVSSLQEEEQIKIKALEKETKKLTAINQTLKECVLSGANYLSKIEGAIDQFQSTRSAPLAISDLREWYRNDKEASRRALVQVAQQLGDEELEKDVAILSSHRPIGSPFPSLISIKNPLPY